MDQKKRPNAKFEDKVEEIFSEVLHLEHHPPQEGLDGTIFENTSGVFDELSKIVKNLRPKPQIPTALPPSPSHNETSENTTHFRTSNSFSIIRDVFSVLSIAAIVFFIFNFIFYRFRVSGPSMEPSISHKNFTMINQRAYATRDIQRGDIIALYNPNHPDEQYIKRVVGIPGDEIEIIGGWLYINDLLIDEPYLGTPDNFDFSLITIPENTVFVLGDNRRVSEDSRIWGPVSTDYIIGRADFVYWPITDFGLINHYHSSILTP